MNKESLYENARSFDAYYYSFAPVGEYRFDVILHAVAKAGKSYHGTEDWGNETAPYTEHLSGDSPIDWIQNAVASANSEFQDVKRQRDQLLEALKELHRVIDSAGVMNLMRGVQLGAVVWSIKANDAMFYASEAVAAAEPKP